MATEINQTNKTSGLKKYNSKSQKRIAEFVTKELDMCWGESMKDPKIFFGEIIKSMVTRIGTLPVLASNEDWYFAIAYLINDVLSRRRLKASSKLITENHRRVYYLSMEYLPGRSLRRHLTNLDLWDSVTEALESVNVDILKVEEVEPDAGLGNGGLGRLADCFLDSLATHNYPATAYGIRYEYGLFKQEIQHNQQVETPDNWLSHNNPWEVERQGVVYPIKFYGHVSHDIDENGQQKSEWQNQHIVNAAAFDFPISGYDTQNVSNLRLWSARSSSDLNMQAFNNGNYIEAMYGQIDQETISKILYPNDNSQTGKELRLKQEYFFTSASVQDIITTYLYTHENLDHFYENVCLQLNDTHPAFAVPELMYQLIDNHGYTFDKAWEITSKSFNYTNHTLLPEALEKWNIDIVSRLLPRHLEIIYKINDNFLTEVRTKTDDIKIIRNLSLIDDQSNSIRMANMSIVASGKVNGVAKLHTDLLQDHMFKDYTNLYPNKFINATNGISPRRWIYASNPRLTQLYSTELQSKEWIKDLKLLNKLEYEVTNEGFLQKFVQVKQDNKQELADHIKKVCHITVDPQSMFDTQVKRIHEYKRQLLNLLHVISRYHLIKSMPNGNYQPRTFIFSGKAAPGYHIAKRIIHLINDVACTVNNDPLVSQIIKVVYVPNYNVSNAEKIYVGTNLSEQISTAGTEASGTGNMKFALNGALTIGTLDGANIEIMNEVGKDNIFIFGMNTEEIMESYKGTYDHHKIYNNNILLKQSINSLIDGTFNRDLNTHRDVYNVLLHSDDHYRILGDFNDYYDKQLQVDELYATPTEWHKKAFLNSVRIGYFSSDRTISEYADNIWHIKKLI